MDPTQRCFSIDREGDLPNASAFYCLANFKDKFVFLFSDKDPYRYSLAEDKQEKLPMIPIDTYPRHPSACSLGDKVYVLDQKSRSIKVLHNPDASVSSEEMHQQEIEMPGDIPIPCYDLAFAPLNSTEIVIAGGMDKYFRMVGDIVIFDTTTCEFKKEVVNKLPFKCINNQSANVCENTIIAIVTGNNDYGVLKYTKGDTSATFIDIV